MQKILIIDDDAAIRGLIRARLQSTYHIIDSGVPDEALGLALEHKPALILLDLMMPDFSGFELCQTLHSLSYTARIPIFVVTGEAGSKFREQCKQLGAAGYFEKPIDFAELNRRISEELRSNQPERRSHKRVQMKVPIKLVGKDASGALVEESTTTENISAGGFLCLCNSVLPMELIMEVYLRGSNELLAGRARVVRKEGSDARWQKYGFQFVEKTEEWLLR